MVTEDIFILVVIFMLACGVTTRSMVKVGLYMPMARSKKGFMIIILLFNRQNEDEVS